MYVVRGDDAGGAVSLGEPLELRIETTGERASDLVFMSCQLQRTSDIYNATSNSLKYVVPM